MRSKPQLASLVCFFSLAVACSSNGTGSYPNAPSGGAGASTGGTPMTGGGGGTSGAGGSVGGVASTAGVGGDSSGGSGQAGGGGPAGGGGSGGGGTGGTSSRGCASGQYLLCEDFDQTEVGAVPAGWMRRGPTDKVGVADDQAKSGTRSLKVGAMESGERRIARSGSVLGAAHWGRVRFKVQLPVTDAFVHSTLVAGFGVGPTKGDVEVRLLDTVKAAKENTPGWCTDKQVTTNCYQLLYNVQPSNSAEFGKAGPYGWTFDEEWHCAEWHVDSTQQSYELFYDGARVDDASFSNGAGQYDNSEIPTAFGEVRVGWNNYQSATNPGFTAWLDDLAFDEQRIGCD